MSSFNPLYPLSWLSEAIDNGEGMPWYHWANLTFQIGPFWMVVYLVFALYSVNYYFCWATLMHLHDTQFGYSYDRSQRAWQIGLAIMIVSTIFKAMWFASWIFALVHTWYCSRTWKPSSSSPKTIMQADPHLGPQVQYFEGHRPRMCPKGCRWDRPDGSQSSDLTDRVYHCTTLHRCLPCYDHFCTFIRVAVYLHTLKSYINFCFWIALDSLFTLIISVIALCFGHPASIAPYLATVLVVGIIIFLLGAQITRHQMSTLGMRNITWAESKIREKGGDPWFLAFKVRTHGTEGEWVLRLRSFDSNPWDLGTRENLRHTLGPWWQWPLFWIQPERVSRYGNYAGWDLPFENEVLEARNVLIGFTGVSTGDNGPSAIQVEGPARRRQNRSSNTSRRSQQRSSGGPATHAGTASHS
ncbi:hypothetical protein F5Y19DRAFT_484619 [Xylariaceae sp. FL1651]|nr:hypothetical protein F5Y19DRAFT_484619 [Xylariaceae sp. FL1651]